MTAPRQAWLFDLDDTLHDASGAVMPVLNQAMTDYVARHLGLPAEEASALRAHYWRRYGATLLGLVRHHGVRAAHFLTETHQLSGMEQRLRTHRGDIAALRRLPGVKLIVTNAPAHHARRVLRALRLHRLFDGVVSIEDMRMFAHADAHRALEGLRPKPDARMFRALLVRLGRRYGVRPHHCTLVEDTLAHQRAAMRVGMRTAWMQRYIARSRRTVEASSHLQEKSRQRLSRKPPYVYARIENIRRLTHLLYPQHHE
jgi:putative hydrolase of the HAD superfamily